VGQEYLAVEQSRIGGMRGSDRAFWKLCLWSVDINVKGNVFLDSAQISAQSQRTGKAGDITIDARQTLTMNNSDITTNAAISSGGEIRVNARDIRLYGESDIRTDVASGQNQGGNITLNANSIVAFNDSDIVAFARDGVGGDITLNTPAFFGFRAAQRGTNPQTLDGNNRVDINATGAIA
jgi:hypothetical protein